MFEAPRILTATFVPLSDTWRYNLKPVGSGSLHDPGQDNQSHAAEAAGRVAALPGVGACVLEGAVADPERPVSKLPLVSSAEPRQLAAWSVA